VTEVEAVRIRPGGRLLCAATDRLRVAGHDTASL
jgi:hypothetical protein